jgi:hypothetical protein
MAVITATRGNGARVPFEAGFFALAAALPCNFY